MSASAVARCRGSALVDWRPALRRATRWPALVLCGLGLAGAAIAHARCIGEALAPAQVATARATAALLHLCGVEVVQTGALLAQPGRFACEVALPCTGVPLAVLLVLGLLGLPLAIRARLAWMLGGAALVVAVNLVRLATLFVVGVRHPEAFGTVHRAVWEPLMLVLVVGVWSAASRRTGAGPLSRSGPTGPAARYL